jgi:ribose transport system substrate-binding protein
MRRQIVVGVSAAALLAGLSLQSHAMDEFDGPTTGPAAAEGMSIVLSLPT